MMGKLTALAEAGGGRVALLSALAALTIPAAILINQAVPNAYMDEEFHIRQVQHYCKGDFGHWDPMITTFPGLYFVTLGYIQALLLLGQVLGLRSMVDGLCQPVVLRSVNIVFCFICALLFREIVLHLDPEKRRISASVKAFVLSLYPLHWFFNFLYYTEMVSATVVMAMYLACLKRAYWSSALFGAMSVFLRQTNVVWVIFVICIGLLDFIQSGPDWRREPWLGDGNGAQASKSESLASEGGESAPISPIDSRLRKVGLKKRQLSTEAQHSKPLGSEKVLQSSVNQNIFTEVWALIKSTWFRRYEVLWSFGPLLLVFVAFPGFVLHNGSIVVGDKSSHKVSLHLAQVLYCGLVITGFQTALHFSPQNLRDLLRVLKTSGKKATIACCIIMSVTAFVSVQFFGKPHPYLLADNRHYVFYLWKDVLQRHWSAKYLFIPLYMLSWWSIINMLAQRQKPLWVLAFFLAVVGVLVPTPLLEFRYYNVPFYFVYLHSCQKASRERYTLALMALEFIVVNIITTYIFLFWPFIWPSEPGKFQRFMW
ncbi:unnamed protein product [Calypogeia fissa]